jgi:hypothetical protein
MLVLGGYSRRNNDQEKEWNNMSYQAAAYPTIILHDDAIPRFVVCCVLSFSAN